MSDEISLDRPVDETEPSREMTLKNLAGIEVDLKVVVGGAVIRIADLLELNESSIIELDRLANDQLDVMINGKLFGKGDIVLVGERLGVIFTEVNSFEERLRNL
jgi:flagellar motor switch protein FliN/FliY